MSYYIWSQVRQNAASQNRDKAAARECSTATSLNVSRCVSSRHSLWATLRFVANVFLLLLLLSYASLPHFVCKSHFRCMQRAREWGLGKGRVAMVQQLLRNRLRFMHFLRPGSHASCVGGFPPLPLWSFPPNFSLSLSLSPLLLALFCFGFLLFCFDVARCYSNEEVASNGSNLLN